MINRWILGAVAVLAVPLVGLALLSLIAKKPANVGVPTAKLAPCLSKNNCVCSQDSGESRIDTIPLASIPNQTWRALKEMTRNDPSMRLVVDRPEYLHVECRTALFRFVDDLEFVKDDVAKVVHVRSGARSGSHDMGANRKRVEAIRAELARVTTATTDRAIDGAINEAAKQR